MVDGGADIQIDKGGFVRIHYAILEQLAAGDFSSREYACILYLLRMTYGFNRKDCKLSYGDFAEGCNVDRTAIIKTLRGLVARSVITKIDGDAYHAATWGFNKYFEQWQQTSVKTTTSLDGETSVKTTTSDEMTSSQNDTSSSVKTTTSPSVKTTTSYISAKDIITDISKDTPVREGDADGYFGMPKLNGNRQSVAAFQATEARKLGVNAEAFRQIVDALIDACGWRALVDEAEDDGKLNIAKDNALALVKMGNTTPAQVEALVTAYRAANAWRNTPPQPRDIVTYASQLKQGIAPKPTNGNGKHDDGGRQSVSDPAVQEARAKAERERQRTAAKLAELTPVKATRIAQ